MEAARKAGLKPEHVEQFTAMVSVTSRVPANELIEGKLTQPIRIAIAGL